MAEIISYEKDRTGDRYKDQWVIKFSGVGDSWTTPKLAKNLRKLYIRNGNGHVHLSESKDPSPTPTHLPPGHAQTLGSRSHLHVKLDQAPADGSDATFYVHAEWYAPSVIFHSEAGDASDASEA